MRKVLENLELILTAAGLLVIFAVPHFWPHQPLDGNTWKITAITAIAVGILHGLIFWAVRRRQRTIRAQALGDAEAMLKDIVNNQLAVIRFTADVQQREGVAIKEASARINNSVAKIHAALENISEESLKQWKDKHSRSDSLLNGSS